MGKLNLGVPVSKSGDLLTFTQDAKWVATNDWLHTKYDSPDFDNILNRIY